MVVEIYAYVIFGILILGSAVAMAKEGQAKQQVANQFFAFILLLPVFGRVFGWF